MPTRSTAQLAQDFPISTTPLLMTTVALFDNLVKQGFLGTWAELNQIIVEIQGALTTLKESYAAPNSVYTGTAGTTARLYSVVPKYALPYPAGSAALPAGKYLLNVPGQPPWGWPPASAAGLQGEGGVKYLWGVPGTAQNVAATAAQLTTANYVTVTTPAAKYIPGTLFDVVFQLVANGPYYLVQPTVNPATAIQDTGAATAANPYYGLLYTPRPAPEVGYDPSYPVGAAQGAGTVVYGPLTRLSTV